MGGFAGFPPETFRFLKQLARHNERDWFQRNKRRYESDVLDPALAFIEAMQQPLAKISPHFAAVPRRSGGSLMRVYRDVRFSADKRPYKTNVGIQFRHLRGRDVHAPGFYLHLEPGQCFIGAGVWRPDSVALGDIRRAIVDSPSLWLEARDARAFRQHFDLGGESLKRPPRGFDGDHPHIEDLKRKDFVGVCELGESFFTGSTAVRSTAARLRASAPFMRFLCGAAGVEFD